MAYEKQNWLSGDVVSSARLNHMEDGIEAAGNASGVLIVPVRMTNTSLRLEKPCLEIKEALDAGRLVLAVGSPDLKSAGYLNVIVSADSKYGGNYYNFYFAGGYPESFSGTVEEDVYPNSASCVNNLYLDLSASAKTLKYQLMSGRYSDLLPSHAYMRWAASNKQLPVDLYTNDGSVCRCVSMHIAGTSAAPYIDSLVYRCISAYPDATVQELRFKAQLASDPLTLVTDT